MKDRLANALMIVGIAAFFVGLFTAWWLLVIGIVITLFGGVVYVSDKGDDGRTSVAALIFVAMAIIAAIGLTAIYLANAFH